MKILITGVGGTGKTTTVVELAKKYGGISIDLDYEDICFWQNRISGARAEYLPNAGAKWLDLHRWCLDIQKLKDLLNRQTSDSLVFVAGKISKSQVSEVFTLFDHIFLLRPSDEVLLCRQSTRTNKKNKFAATKNEQMQIISKRGQFEKVCTDQGAVFINANASIDKVVDLIYRHIADKKSSDVVQ